MSREEMDDYYQYQHILDEATAISKVTTNPYVNSEKDQFPFVEQSYKPGEKAIDDKLMEKNDLMRLASENKYEVNLSHLSGEIKLDADKLITDYKPIFASKNNWVWRFRPYKIQLRVSNEKNTKQNEN